MFAREGYPFILGAAALAAITFAIALRLRSWPLWLVAIVFAIVALGVAWFFRNPARVGERGASVVSAPTDAKIAITTNHAAGTFVIGSRVAPTLLPGGNPSRTCAQYALAGDTMSAYVPLS